MNKPIVLFDGVCNFCNFWVNFAIKHDKQAQLMFASMQSDAGKALIKQYSIETTALSSVLYIFNNQFETQSDAVVKISNHLSGLGKAGIILGIFPRVIGNGIYNFFAKNRYRFFGKKETCMIPNKELKSRFL